MTRLNAAQIKRLTLSWTGKPAKSNPYWYNASIVESIKSEIEARIDDGECTPRTIESLESWIDKLRSTYL